MYTAGNNIESGLLYESFCLPNLQRQKLPENMERKKVPESNTQVKQIFLCVMHAPLICMRFTFLSIMNSVQVDKSQLPQADVFSINY